MNTANPARLGLEWTFRAVLLLLALYHLATGVIAVFFPEFSRGFYQALYHFEPHYWDQYRLILKPWGSYALFTGAVLSCACWAPRKHKSVIWAMTGLLCLRVGYRLICQDEAAAVLGIDQARNYLNVGLMLVWIVVLSVWSLVEARSPRREEADPAGRVVMGAWTPSSHSVAKG